MLQLVERDLDGLTLDLDKIKLHLRVNWDDEDDHIESLVFVALEYVERMTGRSFIPTTWKEILPSFPCSRLTGIELQRSPLITLDEVTYFNSDNEETTLYDEDSTALYVMSGHNLPPRLYVVEDWPSTYTRPDAVSITYQAGYEELPKLAEQAILLLVGHWYANREEEGTVKTEQLRVGVDRLLALMDFRQ